MIKEFLENVQRLYDETVQDKSVRTNQSAADLLDVLLRKVTQPIQVFTSPWNVTYQNGDTSGWLTISCARRKPR